MSNPRLPIASDTGIRQLETAWYEALESNLRARAEYRARRLDCNPDPESIDHLRESLERSAALMDQILNRIERLKFSAAPDAGP
jgi:hypothetical protein